MNSKSVDLTVAIAVKDRPDDLKLAVKSVMSQRVLPNELIIVDDFSGKPVDLEMFGEDLPFPLRILRNAPNLGPAASYNRAVKESASRVVAFLDSDDYFSPDYIAVVFETWEKFLPRPVCVAAGFDWCTNDFVRYRTQIIAHEVTLEALLKKGNFVGGSSVLSVDREAFCSVGGFPDERGASDWGLLLRLAAFGEIKTLKQSLVLYRSPSASKILNDTKNFRPQIKSLLSIWKALPLNERILARPMITALVAMNLAQANRRNLSVRLLRSVFKNRSIPKNIVLRTVIILMIGYKTYDRLLFWLAELRAQFRSLAHKNLEPFR